MNNYLTIIKEDGSEELCRILFTHFEEQFNKHYVVFQPETSDELAAATYIPEGSDGVLGPIETDEEWELIEELVEEYAAAQEENEGCGCGCDSCGDDCECDSESSCGSNCGCGEK